MAGRTRAGSRPRSPGPISSSPGHHVCSRSWKPEPSTALGADDVERLEARAGASADRSRRRYSPSGSAIQSGIGDDDVADRIGGRLAQQPLAQRVLVARARRRRRAARTRGRRARGNRVCRSMRSAPRSDPRPTGERFGDELLEPLHLLRLAAELVVEAQDLGDQAGAKPGTTAPAPARRGGARGRLRDRRRARTGRGAAADRPAARAAGRTARRA